MSRKQSRLETLDEVQVLASMEGARVQHDHHQEGSQLNLDMTPPSSCVFTKVTQNEKMSHCSCPNLQNIQNTLEQPVLRKYQRTSRRVSSLTRYTEDPDRLTYAYADHPRQLQDRSTSTNVQQPCKRVRERSIAKIIAVVGSTALYLAENSRCLTSQEVVTIKANMRPEPLK